MSGGRLLRYSLAGLCIALAAFFLLPLAIGAHHIGMFFPAAVLGVLAWMLLRPQKLKMLLTGKGRILWRSLLALFAAGLLCVAVILGLMAGVVGILFSTPLLELAGAPMDVLPLSSL